MACGYGCRREGHWPAARQRNPTHQIFYVKVSEAMAIRMPTYEETKRLHFIWAQIGLMRLQFVRKRFSQIEVKNMTRQHGGFPNEPLDPMKTHLKWKVKVKYLLEETHSKSSVWASPKVLP